MAIRNEMQQAVIAANCPMFGTGDLSGVIRQVENWMNNVKRDSTGFINQFYKLEKDGDTVTLYRLTLTGDIKWPVAIAVNGN